MKNIICKAAKTNNPIKSLNPRLLVCSFLCLQLSAGLGMGIINPQPDFGSPSLLVGDAGFQFGQCTRAGTYFSGELPDLKDFDFAPDLAQHEKPDCYPCIQTQSELLAGEVQPQLIGCWVMKGGSC